MLEHNLKTSKTVKKTSPVITITASEIKEKNIAKAKSDRDIALREITHSFLDDSIVQVRPSDLSNFQLAISLGVSQKWVMQDNNVRLTTIAELQEAMDSGIAQGKAIWDTYIATIEAL